MEIRVWKGGNDRDWSLPGVESPHLKQAKSRSTSSFGSLDIVNDFARFLYFWPVYFFACIFFRQAGKRIFREERHMGLLSNKGPKYLEGTFLLLRAHPAPTLFSFFSVFFPPWSAIPLPTPFSHLYAIPCLDLPPLPCLNPSRSINQILMKQIP